MADVRVRVTGVKEAIEDVYVRIFDAIEDIARQESAEAVLRIQLTGFGPDTGAGGMPPLKVRSGDALSTMGSDIDRLGPTHIRAEFGALHASPEEAEYIRTQEHGAVITPRFADKLAFPPGDAGPPIRDERGVQLFWASEFEEVAEDYGYSALIWTEDAVLGKVGGTPFLDLLFIRRDQVEIPERRIIRREEEPTRDAMIRRIAALGV